MTDEQKQIALRVDPDLLDAIDRRSKTVNLSRNEWVNKSLRWVIHNLPHGLTGAEKIAAVQAAPAEVIGTWSEDMGLDSPDGKKVSPPDGHWHRRATKPLHTTDGLRYYGCTVADCTWQVAEDEQGTIRMLGHTYVETPMEQTKRMGLENQPGHDEREAERRTL